VSTIGIPLESTDSRVLIEGVRCLGFARAGGAPSASSDDEGVPARDLGNARLRMVSCLSPTGATALCGSTSPGVAPRGVDSNHSRR